MITCPPLINPFLHLPAGSRHCSLLLHLVAAGICASALPALAGAAFLHVEPLPGGSQARQLLHHVAVLLQLVLVLLLV